MRFLIVFLLASCAHPRVESVEVIGPTKPVAVSPHDEWAKRKWEDRHEMMTGFVLPEMSVLFQSFYGTDYPSTTCKTCHGNDADVVEYKMPRNLPPLDPLRMPAGTDPGDRGRVTKFMEEQVTPKMVSLIVRPACPPGSGPNPACFGCFSCHPSTRGP